MALLKNTRLMLNVAIELCSAPQPTPGMIELAGQAAKTARRFLDQCT
jgi:hypothetical protein